MEYRAHKISDNNTQSILSHLNGTKQLACTFALPEWKEITGTIAYAHDIGKYAIAFQDRLDGKGGHYPHAAPGAIELRKLANGQFDGMLACLMAYCIAGHHTGLPDGGVPDDKVGGTTLSAILKDMQKYQKDWDYSAYQNEVNLNMPDPASLLKLLADCKGDKRIVTERFAFITRYLFSCLTDADFLDTERYYSPQTDRNTKVDFQTAASVVTEKLAGFDAETELQKARAVLQKQAFENAEESSGISTLTMPTGSGKTLCSLHIALQKILHSNGRLNRIIYVIPYTSIIEQTAAEFEELIGKYVTILQHHSNFCFEDIPDADTVKKLKLASENWDAPVIITTSVQFFESLYHYKSSKLRKLHNLANAVIVLDEIHMLPVKQLQPCLSALSYLTKILHSEILMLSATMPDYAKQFHHIAPDQPVNELITDQSAFRFFEKCSYHDLGETDYESIAERAATYQSSLIVVNSRAAAREVYSILGGTKYHLSTFMTPYDRSRVIEEIRKKLGKEQITVVSTSLIEAGVDLDFEAVFRELAGIDNILQSGGRCNREGKRDNGDVFIFRTDRKPQRDLAIRAKITTDLMEKYQNITAPECIRAYYDRLFNYHDELIKKNTISSESTIYPKQAFVSIPFRQYAKDFEMIETDTVSVVIPQCGEAKELLEKLRCGDRSVLQRLQKYSVSLRVHGEYDKAVPYIVSEYEKTGILVLTDATCYEPETGLHLENSTNGFFDE